MKLMMTINVSEKALPLLYDLCDKWIDCGFCEEYQVYDDDQARPDIIIRDED